MKTTPSPGRVTSFILLLSAFLFSSLSVSAQIFEWGYQPDSGFYYNASDGVIDNLGNTYLTGSFNSTFFFGNGVSLQSSGGRDIYLLKLSPNGTPIWVRKAGGYQHDAGASIAIDGFNNVFITGHCRDSAFFANTTLIPNSQSQDYFFIAKYSPNGVLQWVKQIIEGGTSLGLEITTDNAGNVYAAGTFSDTAIFDTTSINVEQPSTSRYSFIAKYTTSGSLEWVRYGVCHSVSFISGLDYDPHTNNILCGGKFADSISFDTTMLYAQGNNDLFIFSLGAGGLYNWIKKEGGNGSNEDLGVLDVGPNGNFCIAGGYQDSIALSGNIFNATNNNALPFIALYDSSGTYWGSEHGSGTGSGTIMDLEYESNGQISATGIFSGDMGFQGNNLVAAQPIETFVFQLDSLQNFDWILKADSSTGSNVGNTIISSPNNTLTILGNHQGVIKWGQYIAQNQFLFDWVFLTKFKQDVNVIRGLIFMDTDSNNIFNQGDFPLANNPIKKTPQIANRLSNSSGIFFFIADSGTHAISISNPPQYFSFPIDTQTVSFSGYGMQDTSASFPVRYIPGIRELAIIPWDQSGPFGWGFIQRARKDGSNIINIDYANQGTVTIDAQLEVELDMDFHVFKTEPPADSIDSVSNKFYWDLGQLTPLQASYVTLKYHVDSLATLGDTALSYAYISPIAGDTIPHNNRDTIPRRIVASYDPNDKNVSRDTITPEQVANGVWLNYLIRFQNTGNDTAYDIVIEDTLSSLLDLSTFTALGSSHKYTVNMDEAGVLKWTFANINLPDSGANLSESNGDVSFRIQPKKNLILGDEIENKAYIYFDFNAPIITNTAITRVDTFNLNDTIDFILPIQQEELDVRLFPNPNNGEFQLQVNSTKNDQLNIVLLNTSGALIASERVNISKGEQVIPINWNKVSNGMYFVIVQTDRGITAPKRILIQH